jgi:hypothetical protein
MADDSLKTAALAAWLNIVYGGQDTREYTYSLRLIRRAIEKVPEHIKITESD